MDISGIGALARKCGGVWQYLIERVRGRTMVQLERERNQGTAQVIMLLPPGGEVWETEAGGRTRIIRTPGNPSGLASRSNRYEASATKELPR